MLTGVPRGYAKREYIEGNINMLLLVGGVLLLCGASFAQNLAPLKNLVGEKSTIYTYGPYYHNGTKFWVAHIEPENQSYVLYETGLVKDAELAKKVLVVHETTALAAQRSGFWRYYAAPAKLAVDASSVAFGFAERVVPAAFGAAKILFRVSEIFMPEPAAVGVSDAAERFFVAGIGLQKENLGLCSAGWEARLALERVTSERSYESVAEYSKKAGVVSTIVSSLTEKTQNTDEKMGALADAMSRAYPGFANSSSAKDFFREQGEESLEKNRKYAQEFSFVQLKNN